MDGEADVMWNWDFFLITLVIFILVLIVIILVGIIIVSMVLQAVG